MNVVKKLFYVVLFLLVWEILIKIFNIPSYLVPSISDVAFRFVSDYQMLLKHTSVTLQESLIGYVAGILLGFSFSVILIHSSVFKPAVEILSVSSQSIPKIALAPFVVIWFGVGILPKIFFAAFVCFFPIIVSMTKGLSEVDSSLLEYISILKPKKWDMFWLVRFPNSIPMLFSGVKIAIPLSLTGAVVGEYVIADSGLGFLIEVASSSFDTSLAFSAVIILASIGVSQYYFVSYIEKRILKHLGRNMNYD